MAQQDTGVGMTEEVRRNTKIKAKQRSRFLNALGIKVET